MKIILFSFLGLLTVGLCDLRAQSREIMLGDALVVIEHLTLTEANDRKIKRIKTAQADNSVSDSWNVDDFRTQAKGLERGYKSIVAGLKRKGIKFKELAQGEFNEHFASGVGKVVYLMVDYSVREEKNKYLIISMTFKLLTLDKKILLDEPAKEIVKQVRGK